MGTNSRQKGLVVLFSGAAALVVAAGAIACGNGDDNSDTTPPVVDGGGPVVTTTTIEKDDAASLVIDGQVYATLQSINLGEQNLANLGLQQGSTGAITSESIDVTFAQGLIGNRLTDFADLESLHSIDTPDSTSFQAAVNATVAQLTPLTGTTFDSAFLTAEVSLQQTALNVIDTKVIPVAISYDMQTIATETRNLIAQHLTNLQALQADAGN